MKISKLILGTVVVLMMITPSYVEAQNRTTSLFKAIIIKMGNGIRAIQDSTEYKKSAEGCYDINGDEKGADIKIGSSTQQSDSLTIVNFKNAKKVNVD